MEAARRREEEEQKRLAEVQRKFEVCFIPLLLALMSEVKWKLIFVCLVCLVLVCCNML